MSTLYFDLGNTKAKWFWQGQIGSLAYEGFQNSLPACVHQVDRLVVASVLGESQFQQVVSNLKAVTEAPIKRCIVTAEALGVTCAYQDTSKLGVDRWLALLAGWHRYSVPCVVADLGTAATVDVVGSGGDHQGGYIVSGLMLALEGLLQGTQNIKPDPLNFRQAQLGPGCSTAEAVYNGALLSLVSLIETSYQNLLKSHSEAKLILAGGDAPIVGSHLTPQYELIEDLVFQGMQLLDRANLVVDA